MYGGEGTGSSASGTVPEETSYHTSEEDYYHYPGENTGDTDAGTVPPNKQTDESKTESEDSFLETDETGEEFGGPVKSFLEHLEDFRWVLIKSIAAVLVAMVVCLVAIPSVVGFLTWPLRNPWITDESTNQVVRLHFGTNTWEVPLATNQVGSLNIGTNRFADLDLVPTIEGTNLVLALRPTPEDARSASIPKVPSLVLLDPVEGFTVAIQVAIYGGIGLASPFVLLFVGQFLVPALKKKEKRYLYYGVMIGAGLFLLGVAFCYSILMPVAVYATVQFGNWMGFSSDIWRGAGYLSFITKFMIGMGLMFELPVVLLTLVKIGILDHQKLSKFRPYWLIVNLTLCGFITPSGDPFSMLLMAVPIHVLYEVSYGIARYWAWRDRKREAAEAPAGTD
ncbi:MAG: twin-arginine translocase subunit TatC, partial [Pedosphaera parvula]|nr:twin-arginine translocase subunit TatC [Pedosphaera parvula]